MWLTQDEITFLFERDKSVISRHIRNIFVEGELEKDRVVAKNATTASDGKTYEVIFYNLDVVVSVGYRVKSQRGILFRKWANKVLKQKETMTMVATSNSLKRKKKRTDTFVSIQFN